MNPHLHVQVRLNGSVVDDRLVEVRRQVWLGECDGAAVPFTGGILAVQAAEGDLWLRGQRLQPGVPAVRTWGPVEVVLEVAIPERLPRDWTWVPDPMLLITTVALILIGAFVDTVRAELSPTEPNERVAISVQSAEERYPEAAPAPAGRRPLSSEWPPVATFSDPDGASAD